MYNRRIQQLFMRRVVVLQNILRIVNPPMWSSPVHLRTIQDRLHPLRDPRIRVLFPALQPPLSLRTVAPKREPPASTPSVDDAYPRGPTKRAPRVRPLRAPNSRLALHRIIQIEIHELKERNTANIRNLGSVLHEFCCELPMKDEKFKGEPAKWRLGENRRRYCLHRYVFRQVKGRQSRWYGKIPATLNAMVQHIIAELEKKIVALWDSARPINRELPKGKQVRKATLSAESRKPLFFISEPLGRGRTRITSIQNARAFDRRQRRRGNERRSHAWKWTMTHD